MQIPIRTQENQSNGAIEVEDSVFAAPFREGLVHQVVTAQLARVRSGTHSTKKRGEVRGGGRKPWRQKGTGRARAGSNRSPLWRGGGVVFGPKPRSYDQKINKKMHRGALRDLLAELVRRDELVVLDHLQVTGGKTHSLARTLRNLDAEGSLIVIQGKDPVVERAGNNLPKVRVMECSKVGPLALVQHPKVVITQSALRGLEERLS